jgi:hypothetical protein
MRKSPIRHTVHTHMRAGVRVHNYIRGHGKKAPNISKPVLSHGHDEAQSRDSFGVIIRYTDLPDESFSIKSTSYPEAIESALKKRPHITPPYQIEAAKS